MRLKLIANRYYDLFKKVEEKVILQRKTSGVFNRFVKRSDP